MEKLWRLFRDSQIWRAGGQTGLHLHCAPAGLLWHLHERCMGHDDSALTVNSTQYKCFCCGVSCRPVSGKDALARFSEAAGRWPRWPAPRLPSFCLVGTGMEHAHKMKDVLVAAILRSG